MNRTMLTIIVLILCTGISITSREDFESDIIKTANGDLELTFIKHGTLMFNYNGKIIHIDPVDKYADYTMLPKADLILITHEHSDHFCEEAINKIRKEGTEIICTERCAEQLNTGAVMKNGDEKTAAGFKIEALPAYNPKRKRILFIIPLPKHDKGEGNGYIITFADKKIYVAGDTDYIPEMNDLKNIDIAFLPMNRPTMNVKMAAEAAKAFRPKILYPYHYGSTGDTKKLRELLKDEKDIEVRIRKLTL